MEIQEIKQYLRTKIFGKKIFTFDKIDSTNLKAKELVRDGAIEGTIVIADEQTAGRGRFDRPWFSERGKNLTFSLIVAPKIKTEYIGILSLYACLAVSQTVKKISNITPECKWPNDVLIGNKKLCGILSEAIMTNSNLEAIIIGVGINVNQTVFPDEIKSAATSLSLSAGKQFNRFEILAAILDQLEILYDYIQNDSSEKILAGWKEYNAILGKEIMVNKSGKSIKGIASRLDKDGGLIMQTNKGEIKILAGDVTICF